MGKRNKNKKKQRKSKGFDKDASRGRDEVTGLTLDLPGIGEVKSDKVYRLGGTLNPEDPDARFEIEFGDEKYIIINLQSSSKDSNSFRAVLEGEFRYSESTLESAVVYRQIDMSRGGGYGYGGIGDFPGGVKVANPSSLFSWQSGYNASDSVQVANFDEGLNTQGEITGDYSSVRNYAGGRFFPEGWWTDPFTTNLI